MTLEKTTDFIIRMIGNCYSGEDFAGIEFVQTSLFNNSFRHVPITKLNKEQLRVDAAIAERNKQLVDMITPTSPLLIDDDDKEGQDFLQMERDEEKTNDYFENPDLS